MTECEGRLGCSGAAKGYGCFERLKLFVGHNDQEGFQQHNRFPKAGVQIELALIQGIPKTFVVEVPAANQFIRCLAEFVVQVPDQVTKGRRLVYKLRPL